MADRKVNWFGATLVTRELLSRSKSGKPDGDPDSFVAKMNRPNLPVRVNVVLSALHAHGPTIESAKAIQAGGGGFFTDVSEEAMAEVLATAVERLRKTGVLEIDPAEVLAANEQG